LALTVVLSLLASYFVAMTIVPLFCARFLKAHPGDSHHHAPEKMPKWFFLFNKGFTKLMMGYDVTLQPLLKFPTLTVVTLMALFGASLFLYPRLGTAFFPKTDPGSSS
jgi:multidrug efflux pump subunit AcrB